MYVTRIAGQRCCVEAFVRESASIHEITPLKRPQDARHLRHALALSQRQLRDLAESHDAKELTSLAAACEAAGEEGEQILHGWRASRCEVDLKCERSSCWIRSIARRMRT